MEGKKGKPVNPSLKILCQILNPHWGTKLRYILYLINHHCANHCWWDCGPTFHSVHLHFMEYLLVGGVLGLYKTFLGNKWNTATWFLSSLPVPPHGPGNTNHGTPPGFRTCSDRCWPRPHILSFALSSLLCASNTHQWDAQLVGILCILPYRNGLKTSWNITRVFSLRLPYHLWTTF